MFIVEKNYADNEDVYSSANLKILLVVMTTGSTLNLCYQIWSNDEILRVCNGFLDILENLHVSGKTSMIFDRNFVTLLLLKCLTSFHEFFAEIPIYLILGDVTYGNIVCLIITIYMNLLISYAVTIYFIGNLIIGKIYAKLSTDLQLLLNESQLWEHFNNRSIDERFSETFKLFEEIYKIAVGFKSILQINLLSWLLYTVINNLVTYYHPIFKIIVGEVVSIHSMLFGIKLTLDIILLMVAIDMAYRNSRISNNYLLILHGRGPQSLELELNVSVLFFLCFPDCKVDCK